MARRRLLTIGHSYVVAGNRRLADEMARQAGDRWDVTAVAPRRLPAELRDIELEPIPNEACSVRALPVSLGAIPHLRWYRRLREIFRERWDVVHIWEEPFLLAGAQIAGFSGSRARVIPATFQNIAKRYPPPFQTFERLVLRRAAGWIAFGRSVHEVQQRKPAYAARPSRIISPGVDLVSFRPNPDARRTVLARLGWDDDSIPIVGFLGRFVSQKGLGILTAALEETSGPWRALFVGGGPLLEELSSFAKAHEGRVRVVTDVEHGAVPAYLNAMDMLCAPSQTTPRWREQFGRMLIEAMACGVPIVASDSGEIPHVVGDAGVIVPERAVPLWTRAIERLLGDPRERSELSARGLTRANECYAMPVVARAHLDFFEELSGASATRGQARD